MNMYYSEQKWFCNNCGKEQLKPLAGFGPIGREWKVCSIECNREMHMKYTCSILGKNPHKEVDSMGKLLGMIDDNRKYAL